MQATLQNENGETSMVVINLATQPDGSVHAISEEEAHQLALQAAANGGTLTTEDGSMIITTTAGGLQDSQGNQITLSASGGDEVVDTGQTVSMVMSDGTIHTEDGQEMMLVVQEEEETTSSENITNIQVEVMEQE